MSLVRSHKNTLEYYHPIWSLSSIDDFLDRKEQLAYAKKYQDVDVMYSLLTMPSVLRGFIVRHGHEGHDMKDVLDIFMIFLEEAVGHGITLETISTDDLFSLLHTYSIPEFILAEIAEVLFFYRDIDLFKILLTHIENASEKKLLRDYHTKLRIDFLATTWQASIEEDYGRAHQKYKDIHAQTLDIGDYILLQKVKHGIVASDTMDLIQRKNHFRSIAESMLDLYHVYDAIEVLLDYTYVLRDIALQEEDQRKQRKILKNALAVCQDTILQKEKDITYPVLGVMGLELMALLKSDLDLNAKMRIDARKHLGMARKLRKRYNWV